MANPSASQKGIADQLIKKFADMKSGKSLAPSMAASPHRRGSDEEALSRSSKEKPIVAAKPTNRSSPTRPPSENHSK